MQAKQKEMLRLSFDRIFKATKVSRYLFCVTQKKKIAK